MYLKGWVTCAENSQQSYNVTNRNVSVVYSHGSKQSQSIKIKHTEHSQ